MLKFFLKPDQRFFCRKFTLQWRPDVSQIKQNIKTVKLDFDLNVYRQVSLRYKLLTSCRKF